MWESLLSVGIYIHTSTRCVSQPVLIRGALSVDPGQLRRAPPPPPTHQPARPCPSLSGARQALPAYLSHPGRDLPCRRRPPRLRLVQTAAATVRETKSRARSCTVESDDRGHVGLTIAEPDCSHTTCPETAADSPPSTEDLVCGLECVIGRWEGQGALLQNARLPLRHRTRSQRLGEGGSSTRLLHWSQSARLGPEAGPAGHLYNVAMLCSAWMSPRRHGSAGIFARYLNQALVRVSNLSKMP